MRQTPHDTNSSHILKTISLFHYSILFTTCTITSPQFSLAQSFMLSSRTINNKYTRPISTVYIQDGRQVLLIFSQLLCLPLWLHRFSYGMRQDWSDSYCAFLCGFIGSVTVCARIGRTVLVPSSVASSVQLRYAPGLVGQLLCLPLWLHRFSYGMRQDWSDNTVRGSIPRLGH